MKNLYNSTISKNLIANIFGVGIQLINQVILIPLYLIYWPIDLYSDWIVITALSAFFSMSDMGLNSVTQNQFSISYNQNRLQECESLLTNNYILVFCMGILMTLGSIIFVTSFNIIQILNLHYLSRIEASIIFILLLMHIFIGMGSTVLDSVYRSQSLTYKAIYIGQIARLCECIIILLSLILKIPILWMVLLYLAPRIISLIYRINNTKKYFDYRFSLKSTNILLLKQIIVPSITFMSFPIGNAIIYQGFTLVVNKIFGADALVLFNTIRTLCNFVKTMITTILQAVWPEFTIAYSKKNIMRMKSLFKKVMIIANSSGIILCTFILSFGPWIYRIWTAGSIDFNYPLAISFIIVLLFYNIWSSSYVVLVSTNKHSRLGIAYLILSCIAIIIAMLIGESCQSLPMVEICLLIVHIPLSFYALRETHILFKHINNK